jgi:hypothetical protein
VSCCHFDLLQGKRRRRGCDTVLSSKLDTVLNPRPTQHLRSVVRKNVCMLTVQAHKATRDLYGQPKRASDTATAPPVSNSHISSQSQQLHIHISPQSQQLTVTSAHNHSSSQSQKLTVTAAAQSQQLTPRNFRESSASLSLPSSPIPRPRRKKCRPAHLPPALQHSSTPALQHSCLLLVPPALVLVPPALVLLCSCARCPVAASHGP